MERRGVEYASQSPEVKEKVRNSNIQNLGVENPSQSPIIQSKKKDTSTKNWGTDHPMKSPVFKAQVKSSYKERFSVEFAPQKHLQNLKDYDSKEFWVENFGEYKNNVLYIDFGKIYEHFGILAHSTIYNKLKSFGLEFRKKSTYGVAESIFLDALNIPNLKRQYKIGNFKVDGYDPETNTIYEFLGDYWHGNLRFFSPEEVNQNNKETFLELNTKTFERLHDLLKQGYKVKYIWESDFYENGLKSLIDYEPTNS